VALERGGDHADVAVKQLPDQAAHGASQLGAWERDGGGGGGGGGGGWDVMWVERRLGEWALGGVGGESRTAGGATA